MDTFPFQEDLLLQQLLWALSPDPPNLSPPIPAFVPYVRPQVVAPTAYTVGGRNIHQRLIGFLRSTPQPAPEYVSGGGECRVFRHMMRERQRREKLSQSYSDLRSIVSVKSKKADKNSIVQSAIQYVRELKRVEDDLRRHNEELKTILAAGEYVYGGESVRIYVANPESAIDSMIGALRCLQGMGVKATGIRSELSGHKLSAVVNVQTSQDSAGELEMAVKRALHGL